jgi:hypothetical protein
MVIKLLSTSFYSYSKKPANQNTVSNKYFVLIGQYNSMCTKIILKSFIMVKPDITSLLNNGSMKNCFIVFLTISQ